MEDSRSNKSYRRIEHLEQQCQQCPKVLEGSSFKYLAMVGNNLLNGPVLWHDFNHCS